MAKVKIGEIRRYKLRRDWLEDVVCDYAVATKAGLVLVKTWRTTSLFIVFVHGYKYYLECNCEAGPRQAVRLAREFANEVLELSKEKR